MESIIWRKIDKETHELVLNGVSLGKWNRSQMRHLIQETDNAIEDYLNG